MITFLDLDGVLADFHAGASRLAGVEPITTPAHRARGGDCRSDYEMSTSHGGDIWERIIATGPAFWRELNPTPWCADLVAYARAVSTELYVLSSPGGQLAATSVPGKLAWCQRHLPSIPVRHCIMTSQKHLLAAPGRLLVDDCDAMADAFTAAGGTSWILPQPWNRRAAETPIPVVPLLADRLHAGVR